MDWVNIIWAGIVATAAMAALMYARPVMGMSRMDIAQMQGQVT